MHNQTNHENDMPRISSIGGQALMEGVMMKSPTGIAMAVRKESGEILAKYEDYQPWNKKNRFFSMPIVRGCVNFVESMVVGMNAMTFSAEALELEEEEPTKFELWLSKKFGLGIEKIVIGVAVVMAVILAVGLFIALPSFIGSMLVGMRGSVFLTNIIEGVTRIAIFLGYLFMVSKMKDIKRVFMYHGAEHKTIACYESRLPLTVENVAKQNRLHPRCGTNYLFLVMAVSILFYSCLGFNGHWALKILIRIAFLPVVAGLSYEVLKAASASNSLWARIVRWPGLKLQLITTSEPDDSMMEIAIHSFELALDPQAYYNQHPDQKPQTNSGEMGDEKGQITVSQA